MPSRIGRARQDGIGGPEDDSVPSRARQGRGGRLRPGARYACLFFDRYRTPTIAPTAAVT